MRVRAGVAILIVVAIVIASVTTRTAPWATLPSGSRVRMIAVGHVEVLGDRPVLRLRYQTDIPLADTARLRAQARELWPGLGDVTPAV